MGMDVYGIAPANKQGEYFRANVWSWRPIHRLCETVTGTELNWGYNDGQGYKTQAECNVLADKLEHYLAANPREEIAIESDCRVSDRGAFLPRGSMAGKSAYHASRDHVGEFITFLRHCGGFKIW